MSELVDKLRREFQDPEYRHSYAEECLNTMIATQIKVLREQRAMTQSTLAKKAGMLQPRLSVMEDANYSSWSVKTLRRLAQAFDLALSVKFESFSEAVLDFEELSRESLERPSFKDDAVFRSPTVSKHRYFHKRNGSEAERDALQGPISSIPEFTRGNHVPNASANTVGETRKGYLPKQDGGIANASGISADS